MSFFVQSDWTSLNALYDIIYIFYFNLNLNHTGLLTWFFWKLDANLLLNYHGMLLQDINFIYTSQTGNLIFNDTFRQYFEVLVHYIAFDCFTISERRTRFWDACTKKYSEVDEFTVSNVNWHFIIRVVHFTTLSSAIGNEAM